MASVSPAAKEREKLLHVRVQMIARCYKPSNPHFKNYGGRGITVCNRWLRDPRAFVADVAPRPAGMTLERPDNSRGYGPDNFRWATRHEQARNKRNNIWCEIDGERMVLKDACAKLGLRYGMVTKRVSRGTPPQIAISQPSRYAEGTR